MSRSGEILSGRPRLVAPGPTGSFGRWRRPAVATGPMIGRLLAFLFGACALIGLVGNVLAVGDAGSHARGMIVGDVIVLLLAPLFLRMRRLRPWVVNAATMTGTVLITVAVHLMGEGSAAVSGSMLYLLVVLPSFYLYPRPVAWGHAVLVGALSWVVLRGNTALGPQEMVRGTGATLALAVIVSWLVRAGDETERDYVTGLTNRRGFERRAQEFLQGYDGRPPAALVVIDLDGFETINEQRGRARCDDLLLGLARDWSRVLPEDALLARHGGDEFTLLLADVSPPQLEETLGRMRAAAPFLTFTAGVAWCAAGEALTMLMLRADAAVLQAKRLGSGHTVTAAAASDSRSGEDIRRALAREEFVLHYQPIVNLDSGMVEKAEALVRWLDPNRGLVPPDEFIALAEQTGTMVGLGDWVLATACRAAASWPANPAGRELSVSVNASGAELSDPTYAERVLRHLSAARLAPSRLVVELVETDYSVAAPRVQANLRMLVDAGVKLAIDDFGTGHSSLSRLDRLPVDILKIDRSFIAPLADGPQSLPLVTAMLAMADALDLEVVAEGVETPEQAAWLRSRGCSHAQGYLYSRPVPELTDADLGPSPRSTPSA